MSTTITGKLNKTATQFQAGDSTGFGVRIGVKYYDRETKQSEWTNYECVIFAKAQAQIQFYQQALVEGSIIEITGKEQKIKQFQGQNGLSLSIEILNASIGFVGTTGQQQPQQQAPQQQQSPPRGQHMKQPSPQQNPNTPVSNGGFGQDQPSGQPAPQPQQGGGGGFDSDIPFMRFDY